MERKSIEAEIKDVDTKKGIVSMYVSSFDVIDSDNDKIVKGAYDETIKESGPKSSNPRIKHLLNHDTNKLIGRPLEMNEDNYGLHVDSLISKTSLGKDALILYQDEVITEHSVGFIAEGKVDKSNYKEINKIKLFEYSSVVWGANQYTPVTGLKNYSFDQLNEKAKKLSKVLSNGSLSDETFKNIEYHVKELSNHLDGRLFNRFCYKHVESYSRYNFNYNEFFLINKDHLGLMRHDPDLYFFQSSTNKDFDFTSDTEDIHGLARCEMMQVNVKAGHNFYDTLFLIGHEIRHLYQYAKGWLEKGNNENNDQLEADADAYGHNMARWYIQKLHSLYPWMFNYGQHFNPH